jgi:hypothetical protein
MSLKEKLKPIDQKLPDKKNGEVKKSGPGRKIARVASHLQQPENANSLQEAEKASDLQSQKEAQSKAKLKELTKLDKRVHSVVVAAARLADRLTEEDRQRAKDTIAEAMSANGCRFNTETKLWEEFPDHRTRLAAATLQLAYDEGTPIQRQIVLTGKFDTDEAILDRLAASPEASAALAALEKAGFVVNRPQAGPILEAEIVPSEG